MCDISHLSPSLSCSLPTMILTECVLIYMEPEKSREVVKWFGKQFKTALFLNYEPVRPVIICVVIFYTVVPQEEEYRTLAI